MVSNAQLRWIRRILTITQGALALAAVSLLLAAVLTTEPQMKVADTVAEEAADESASYTSHPLSWYAPLWQRDFRQSPVPSDVTERPEATPPSELPRLLGTFVEPDRQFAHFRTESGKTCVRTINGTVDAYRVVAIQTGRAQLRHGAESYWIEAPRRNRARRRQPANGSR